MFFNEFKYSLISTMRNKHQITWLILFPIVLGIMFKAAFSGLYEKDMTFTAIPTAVVMTQEDDIFKSVIEAVSEGDGALLEVTYSDKEEAEKLMLDGEVKGIIYCGEKISLTVSGKGMEETILKSFTDRYLTQEKIIMDAIEKDPMKLPTIVETMSEELNTLKEEPLTQGDPDVYISYFYNLLAMVAVCGSITGLSVVTQNQADQSPLGARKGCSPTPKLISTVAVLSGCWLVGTICMMISVSFVAFVLRINFGDRLPLVYLSSALGGIMGTSMGFMLGSLVKGSYEKKNSIAMTVSLGGCGLSGLFVYNIRPFIAENVPIVNKLNPAAVVCDSFYYLNIDEGYDRYISKLITMIAMTTIFTLIGFIFTRRKKYASL